MKRILSVVLVASLAITGFAFSSFAKTGSTEISKHDRQEKKKSDVRKNNKKSKKHKKKKK